MLGNVATITLGHPFRARIESADDGAVIVIQSRDLSDDGTVDVAGALRVDGIKAKNSLQPGDVILQPRGTRLSVSLFEGAPKPAIVAAPLYQIRPDGNCITPEFLALLLRSPKTQSELRQGAAGTHVPLIPRQSIEELTIELPDLQTQAKLVELALLARQEEAVMQRIRDARLRLFDLAVEEASRKARRCANTPGT